MVHATYLGLEMHLHLEHQTSALVSLILSLVTVVVAIVIIVWSSCDGGLS